MVAQTGQRKRRRVGSSLVRTTGLADLGSQGRTRGSGEWPRLDWLPSWRRGQKDFNKRRSKWPKCFTRPGYGAGWSTWNSGTKEFERWFLTYQPIIDALEKGEALNEEHAAVRLLVKEAKERFGMDYVCTLGADDLRVTEVSGPFRVEEYDGSERIVLASEQEWVSI